MKLILALALLVAPAFGRHTAHASGYTDSTIVVTFGPPPALFPMPGPEVGQILIECDSVLSQSFMVTSGPLAASADFDNILSLELSSGVVLAARSEPSAIDLRLPRTGTALGGALTPMRVSVQFSSNLLTLAGNPILRTDTDTTLSFYGGSAAFGVTSFVDHDLTCTFLP